eukprot:4079329-Pyramimonas_sp.AAC.1
MEGQKRLVGPRYDNNDNGRIRSARSPAHNRSNSGPCCPAFVDRPPPCPPSDMAPRDDDISFGGGTIPPPMPA